MFLAIQGGELFTPVPCGPATVLTCDGQIVKIGEVDLFALDRMDVPSETIDATGCFVIPGLIDVHEHMIGGSGEHGWQSQTPEIALREIVTRGYHNGCRLPGYEYRDQNDGSSPR